MSEQDITVTKVADKDRLNFLPKHFTPAKMILVESAVYDFMGMLCEEYGGGFWDFYELSNGGAYMAPQGEGTVRLYSPNGYSDEVSMETAGIIACLFAYSHLSFKYSELGRHYHLLRDYAFSRPDAEPIIRICD